VCVDDEMAVGRLLMAVLLKHHGLGADVVSLLSADGQPSSEAVSLSVVPGFLVDMCKVVHHARTALIKVTMFGYHNVLSLFSHFLQLITHTCLTCCTRVFALS